MRDYMNVDCVDCGLMRRIETLEHALAPACPTCWVKRAIQDFKDWCGVLEVSEDAESAEEYLYVTDYGSRLPDWIQDKVRAYAAEHAPVII
jgi:hypothetical protein